MTIDPENALQAFEEVRAEIVDDNTFVPSGPDLEEILRIKPVPEQGIIMGMGLDGRPIVIDISDTTLSNILIKDGTPILKTIYHHIMLRSNDRIRVEPYVISESWFPQNSIKFGGEVSNLILSLSAWAHQNREPHQKLVLLIDGLENIWKFDWNTMQNLSWLLLRGPARGVYIVASVGDIRGIQMVADRFHCQVDRDGTSYIMQEGDELVRFHAV